MTRRQAQAEGFVRHTSTPGTISYGRVNTQCGSVGAAAMADTSANGSATDSPGIVSGNNTQIPVHIPVNVTGNGVNIIGLLDSVFDNHSEN